MKKSMIVYLLMPFIASMILMIPNPVMAQTSTISIINPGPASNPTKWNATMPPAGEVGEPSFTFYSNETATGSTFFINVTITNATNMRAWGIGIIYGNTSIAYVSGWRPVDHVFAPAEAQGATPIAPSISTDEVNATYRVLKWGYSYLWQDVEGNPIQWGFNGSGVLCQIQFSLIKQVDEVNTEWASVLAFDPEWTTSYRFDLEPPGKETPNMESALVTYIYIIPEFTILAMVIILTIATLFAVIAANHNKKAMVKT